MENTARVVCFVDHRRKGNISSKISQPTESFFHIIATNSCRPPTLPAGILRASRTWPHAHQQIEMVRHGIFLHESNRPRDQIIWLFTFGRPRWALHLAIEAISNLVKVTVRSSGFKHRRLGFLQKLKQDCTLLREACYGNILDLNKSAWGGSFNQIERWETIMRIPGYHRKVLPMAQPDLPFRNVDQCG